MRHNGYTIHAMLTAHARFRATQRDFRIQVEFINAMTNDNIAIFKM